MRVVQVSRRLARRLNADNRSGKLGFVQLVAEAYLALLRGVRPEDTVLFAKELIIQRVVRPPEPYVQPYESHTLKPTDLNPDM